ncbi:MAG: ribosome small subunit-dependent GTPase A, partial [Bacteroidales bacterium]|nr:ribosome small subunit-dependent GTPase A [Bacteroidales bacterium]
MEDESRPNGLVVRTTGSWYNVLTDGGDTFACRLRGNFRIRGSKQTNPIAVGDRVEFQLLEDGTGVITDIEDRRNYIVRRSTKLSKQTHVIAANIDLLCIVATLGFPRTSTGFIDRLLATAEAYHIPAAIIFNKCDLYGAENGERRTENGGCDTPRPSATPLREGMVDAVGEQETENELWQMHNEIKAIYTSAGYPVYEVSALTGMGIDRIKQLIAGKVCLFSGHSGVGKSALLNAIDPSLQLRTGEVSEWSLKGTHTTTFAEIFPIRLEAESGNLGTENGEWRTENGDISQFTIHNSPFAYLIDTPGIKEFGMVDFSAGELSHFFPEMRSRLQDCRFATCTHRHEPGCAVKEAVENGEISSERYQNYLNIIESIES